MSDVSHKVGQVAVQRVGVALIRRKVSPQTNRPHLWLIAQDAPDLGEVWRLNAAEHGAESFIACIDLMIDLRAGPCSQSNVYKRVFQVLGVYAACYLERCTAHFLFLVFCFLMTKTLQTYNK